MPSALPPPPARNGRPAPPSKQEDDDEDAAWATHTHESTKVMCPNCGSWVDGRSLRCVECGAMLARDASKPPSKLPPSAPAPSPGEVKRQVPAKKKAVPQVPPPPARGSSASSSDFDGAMAHKQPLPPVPARVPSPRAELGDSALMQPLPPVPARVPSPRVDSSASQPLPPVPLRPTNMDLSMEVPKMAPPPRGQRSPPSASYTAPAPAPDDALESPRTSAKALPPAPPPVGSRSSGVSGPALPRRAPSADGTATGAWSRPVPAGAGLARSSASTLTVEVEDLSSEHAMSVSPATVRPTPPASPLRGAIPSSSSSYGPAVSLPTSADSVSQPPVAAEAKSPALRRGLSGLRDILGKDKTEPPVGPPEDAQVVLHDPFWRTQLQAWATEQGDGSGGKVALWTLMDEYKNGSPSAVVRAALAKRIFAEFIAPHAPQRAVFPAPEDQRAVMCADFDELGPEGLPLTFFDSPQGMLLSELEFRLFPRWRAAEMESSPRLASPRQRSPGLSRWKGSSASGGGTPVLTRAGPSASVGSALDGRSPRGHDISAPVLTSGPAPKFQLIPIADAQRDAGVGSEASGAVSPRRSAAAALPAGAASSSSTSLVDTESGASPSSPRMSPPRPSPFAMRPVAPAAPLPAAAPAAKRAPPPPVPKKESPHRSDGQSSPRQGRRAENFVGDDRWDVESIVSPDCTFAWDNLNHSNTLEAISVVKVLVVGDLGVGKTQLCKTMLGDDFHAGYEPTVFETYKVRVPLFKEVPVELWDMSGNPKYDKKRPVVYPNVNALVVCFDLTSRVSWESVKRKWVPEAVGFPEYPLMLVGCKFDCINAGNAATVVTAAEVTRYMEHHCAEFKCCRFFSTSAAKGSGMDDVFQSLIYSVLYDHKGKVADVANFSLNHLREKLV